MIDSYKNKGLRKRLVEQLQNKGIRDSKVLDAILEVPRHFFFPTDFENKAYDDAAFPISDGQTISQPYTVAFQSELLKVHEGAKILEIGTGSGYQAAILAAIGAQVISIERVENLFRSSSKLLSKLGYNVKCFWGDGSKGFRTRGPFDGIIVTAAAPKLAEILKEQLKIGGRLVIPVGDATIQKMVLIKKTVENKYTRTEHGDFTFVPLIGTNGWKT